MKSNWILYTKYFKFKNAKKLYIIFLKTAQCFNAVILEMKKYIFCQLPRFYRDKNNRKYHFRK